MENLLEERENIARYKYEFYIALFRPLLVTSIRRWLGERFYRHGERTFKSEQNQKQER